MKLRPDKPFDPGSFKIYYGWILIPFAVIGVLMSMPGQTAGFSAFTESILKFTGFTRTRLSFLYMIGTISSGFLIPVMGTVLDNWGSRKMMIFASVLLGISLLWLSFIDRIVLAITVVSSPVVYTVLMVLGIFCLRFFGQGLLPMASNTMVAKWFDRKRGRAIAFMGVINAVAFSATPVVMAAVVYKLSWNGAWRLLALVCGIGMTLIAWLFFRDTPESCGLEVDGEKTVHELGDSASSDEVTGVTRGRAIRSRSFWAIALVMSSSSLVLTGLTFHIQEIGVQAGLTVSKAVAIFIPVSFIAIPVSFTSAILTEKIHVRILVTIMAVGQLIAFCAIFYLNTELGYLITIIALGLVNGLFGTVYTAVTPKIFGRRHLGSITGILSSAMIIASALGPIFLSMVNDIVGSLRLGITIMSILPLITIFLSIRMPEKLTEPDERDYQLQHAP
jgi:MFS transporter, OFA family, oxalate/formate antiporter